MTRSIVIGGGTILESPSGPARRGDVVVEGDRITAVGPEVNYPASAMYLDARDKLVIPGLINSHTHAHANIVKGVADNWTLEDLLNYSSAVYGHRTPEEHYLSAALGAVEMLKSGCTASYDLFMCLPAPDPDALEAVVRAYTDVGVRAVIAPAVADIVFHETVPGLVDRLPPQLRMRVDKMVTSPGKELLGIVERFVLRWHESGGGRIRTAVAPSVPGQCTDGFLRGCHRLAEVHGLGLHLHLAETKTQAIHAYRRWGTTIVGALDRLGLLTDRFVGAHSIWITADDMRLLAANGCTVAHNPASNFKLGSGIAPIRELLDRGVNIGLGTDGSISSDNQNMFEAMRLAALASKVRFPYGQDQWLGAADAFRMATIGAARALGMDDQIGALAAGYKADITILDGGTIWLNPVYDYRRSLTYAETGSSVHTVIIDGRIVLSDGKAVNVDERRLRAEVNSAADALWTRQASAWALADELRPYMHAACRSAASQPFPVDRSAAPFGMGQPCKS